MILSLPLLSDAESGDAAALGANYSFEKLSGNKTSLADV